MTVALDAAISGTANNGTTVTATGVACSSADTRLIAFVSLQLAAGPPPTTILHNSVAMTALGNHKDTLGGGIYNISAWYLDNPSVGTFNTVASWTGSTSGAGICSVPVSGCDLTRAPVIGTGADGNSTSASCLVTGAGSNDLQLAGVITTEIVSITAAGTGQSAISATPAMPRININGATSFSADFITAGNSGNFIWTIPSAVWSAIGLTLFGAVTGPIVPGARQTFVNTDYFQY